jgi:hypothetical protein
MFRTLCRVSAISIALSCVFVAAHTVAASDFSYKMWIAEDQQLVKAQLGPVPINPNNPVPNPDPQAVALAQQMASWKTYHELLAARDYPFFQFLNTSQDITSQITNIKITIGDTVNNNFDMLKIFEVSPGMTYQINGLDNVQGALRSGTIDITFTGFTPGRYVRFATEIDCNNGNPNEFCDYRTVLFDMKDSDPSDNSKIDVTFNSPNLPGPQTNSQLLPDYPVDWQTGTGLFGYVSYCKDQVHTFDLTGNVIPEPGTYMLYGMLWVASIVGYRVRRKHSV